jgi:hypothetical protein
LVRWIDYLQIERAVPAVCDLAALIYPYLVSSPCEWKANCGTEDVRAIS